MSRAQVQEFVSRQEFRRPLAPQHMPNNEGRRHGRRLDPEVRAGVWNGGRPRTRWFMDVAKYARHEASRGHDAILVVLDGFSRKVWARALQTATGEDIRAALAHIVGQTGAPAEIVTDTGPDMRNRALESWLEAQGIHHALKEQGDHAVTSQLDAAIRTLKRSIALRQAHQPGWEWSEHLDEVVSGENAVPRQHLAGASAEQADRFDHPSQTVDDADVGFSLERQAAKRLQLNSDNVERRAARLDAAGAFDARRSDADAAFHRGHHRNWDDGHLLSHVAGNAAVDIEGHRFQARLVRADPAGGARAQRHAERYRDLATNWLQGRPGGRATAGELGTFLRQHDLGPKPPAHHLARLLGFQLRKVGPALHISVPA